MMQSIKVSSPKKMFRMEDSGEDDENEKEEYIITNLTENNKKMPSIIVRIPENVNKFLSKEEVKIKFNENIKSPNKKGCKKLLSFKMEASEVSNNEQMNENTIENTCEGQDVKMDSTFQSDETDGDATPRNELDQEDSSDTEGDAKADEDEEDDEDDKEMNESLMATFKKNYVEKYQANVYNESINFLREHTKNELEFFLQRNKLHFSDEMKINDIINIDYDKLNEKNIIPYFLTHMFDVEQKKKREKMKQMLEAKRKVMLEKLKKNNNQGKKGGMGNQKSQPSSNSKTRKRENLPHSGAKLRIGKLKKEKTENGKEVNMGTTHVSKEKIMGEEDDTDGEDDNEDGDEDNSDDKEANAHDNQANTDGDHKTCDSHPRGEIRKGKQGTKFVAVKDKQDDMYIDDFDKEMDINIYKDPTMYGIEGSSEYSEGQKSDMENSQDEELVKDQWTGNNLKIQKKKKKNMDGLRGEEEEEEEDKEKIEDLIDSSTQKLISYDYYSSLNIKEVVKPSYKIKFLTPYIPIEENIDNLDHVQKLQYLIKNLPHTHIKEKRSLYHYNIKQFIKWKVYLLNNINICLYGIGSKYHLLNLFSNICLNDGNKCIILGFEDEINFEEIVIRVLEYHYKYKTSKNLKSFDLLYELIQKVHESNLPLYFIIHNIDNMKLYPYYEYFSFISQYDNIYFVCSIDDVSFELNVNFKNISSINFHYVKCHTWIDYRHEILRQWNKFLPEWVFNKKCEEVDVKKNIETILNALSVNHKRLFKIIASIQLENLEKGIYGVEKESLLQDKRIFTVGASSIRINSLLVEFVSHNVITETRLKEGNTFLKINADKEELKRVAEQL
ncbi:origin recognition complex subunit 2 [Plasmodium gonderi]|uniref:Origin recognition complex subunit 2 n=1 Tax=Plasmodium gonderi TaxID=77519 RepID=A0A1Y1JDR1_PLAGO|nr:origin recognition complex subunit 2 [Plasmodium gonderi]GAW78892.1 origin recognition complex subunit 2 [Plasmodium gonderi]